MSLKVNSLKSFGWDLIGKLGLQGVGFFISIILARLLNPEDFGLLAIILVFTNLANLFLDFGFGTAIVQRKEVNEGHYSSVFFLNIVAGICLCLLVFVIAPYVANFYDNSSLTGLLRLASFSFIINSFGNVTRAYLRRNMNFKLISYSNIVGALLSSVLAVVMALNGFGVWSLIAQILVGQLVANIYLYFVSKVKFKIKMDIQSAKELWRFSSKIFFSGIVDSIFFNLDSLLIGKFLNPAILGFYYRAKSLEAFTFRYTAGSLASVLLPGLSSIQEDRDKLKDVIYKVFHILSFISLFLSGLLLLNSREIIIILFSEKWEPSVIIFQILIGGAFASQIFTLIYDVLLISDKAKTYLVINILSKFLMISNLLVLYFINLEVYLFGFVIIQLATLIAGISIVSRVFNFGNSLLIILLKNFSAFGIIIGFIFYLKNLVSFDRLFLLALVSSLFYLFLIWLTDKFLDFKALFWIRKEIRNYIGNDKHNII